jgi:hypothetical protein
MWMFVNITIFHLWFNAFYKSEGYLAQSAMPSFKNTAINGAHFTRICHKMKCLNLDFVCRH